MSLHVQHAGSGPDLVLLHGWGMHGGVWDEVVPMLAARHRVHAVDLPGHGRSAATALPRFDEAVDAVAQVTPPASLVCGWSLGGLVAQRLASRHPARVRKLVLVSTTPCFARRPDWDAAMAPDTLAAFARGLREDRQATLRRFVQLNALHGARGREAVRAFCARLLAHGEPSTGALEHALAWLLETDVRRDVPQLRQPVLVVHGERDALAPVEAGRWLARTLPAARSLEIADAAHLPFFTHREAFAAAVDSFDG